MQVGCLAAGEVGQVAPSGSEPVTRDSFAIIGTNGIDSNGYNYNALEPNGANYNGINYNGVNSNGINSNGINYNGLDSNGINSNGINYNGINYNGINSNGTDYNGINYNGINSNGINYNGMNYNGYNYNGMNYNGINSNGDLATTYGDAIPGAEQSCPDSNGDGVPNTGASCKQYPGLTYNEAFQAWMRSDFDLAHKAIGYLMRCALRPDQRVVARIDMDNDNGPFPVVGEGCPAGCSASSSATFTNNGSLCRSSKWCTTDADDVVAWWEGRLGLADTWVSSPLTVAQQERVSAALLAHVNRLGRRVQISLRMGKSLAGTATVDPAQAALGWDSTETATYHFQDAVYMGNLFTSPQVKIMCVGSAFNDGTQTALANAALGRSCGISNGQCSFTTYKACVNTTMADNLELRCTKASTNDAVPFSSCTQGNTTWNWVVTSYLAQGCGDGVCDPSFMEDAASCPKSSTDNLPDYDCGPELNCVAQGGARRTVTTCGACAAPETCVNSSTCGDGACSSDEASTYSCPSDCVKEYYESFRIVTPPTIATTTYPGTIRIYGGDTHIIYGDLHIGN
jgi:hypothetical protein